MRARPAGSPTRSREGVLQHAILDLEDVEYGQLIRRPRVAGRET
jgi:hypothetical protein